MQPYARGRLGVLKGVVMKGLYKVSIDLERKWMPKKKPIYAIADSKDDAAKYVATYLNDSYRVGKVSFLGKGVAGYMFHNN